ncbi:MAG: alpha/beta hydrolase [Thermotogota bacterium]
MWMDNIPTRTKITAPECQEHFFHGNDQCILLIHGYTGSPHDMLYLGKRLHEAGFSVFIPRLPGHGTNHIDFLNSNYNQWLRKVVDAYINLNKEFSEVFCCGLSMGGLLTLLLASLFNPRKIALAAPALKASNSLIYLTPLIGLFLKKIKRPVSEKHQEEHLKRLQSEYWDYDWPTKARDLLKLQRLAKARLPKVHSDCLTIVSKSDQTVPVEVLDIIENGIASVKNKRIILEKSPHVVVNDIEKERVAQELIDWFS